MAEGRSPTSGVISVSGHDDLDLVPVTVSEAAASLGLGHTASAKLGVLVGEVISTTLGDAVDSAADFVVDLEVERRPGGLAVVVVDGGGALNLAGGNYPATVTAMIDLGFADSLTMDADGDGVGRIEISKTLAYSSLALDPSFISGAHAEDATAALPDPDEPITFRDLTAGDASGVARLFLRAHDYDTTVSSILCEPDRLAEYVDAGRHIGTIAVATDGRVVAHISSTAALPGATVAQAGNLAFDPAYGVRDLPNAIVEPHFDRLRELGFVGQFCEYTLGDSIGQEVAVAAGGSECVVFPSSRPVVVMFRACVPLPEREVFVPNLYAPIVQRIYEVAGLERAVTSPVTPVLTGVPESTSFSVQLTPEANSAQIWVTQFGRDFDAALQAQLDRLRARDFESITLLLSLSDPAAAHFGAGLREMRLSFCGVYPEYSGGDVLCLKTLKTVELDSEPMQVDSPFGQELLDFVVEDMRSAARQQSARVRSRAHMARVFDALG
jgi:hypothetical protein